MSMRPNELRIRGSPHPTYRPPPRQGAPLIVQNKSRGYSQHSLNPEAPPHKHTCLHQGQYPRKETSYMLSKISWSTIGTTSAEARALRPPASRPVVYVLQGSLWKAVQPPGESNSPAQF